MEKRTSRFGRIRAWRALTVMALGLAPLILLVGVSLATISTAGSIVAGTSGDDLVAGAVNADYDVDFETDVSNASAEFITVVFPAGYTIGAATIQDAVGNAGTITIEGVDNRAVTAVTISGQEVRVQLGTAQDLAGDQLEFRILTGVTNPTVSGATAAFAVRVGTTAGGTEVDSDATAGTVAITAGGLSATNVEPASLVAGAAGNVTVTFTVANPVTNSEKIVVIFPAGFDVASASFGSVGSDLDGTATVGVSGQTVTVTRTGGTTLLATETGSVVLGNITNPPGSGSTGTYTIRTTSAGDVTIDEDTAVSADTITAGALSATNVEPASLAAGVTGNVTVSFTTATALTNSEKIVVIFPAGFDVSGAGFDSVSGSLDGMAAVGVAGQTVTITRTGGSTLGAAASGSVVLSGIKNPVSPGSTGTYTIRTTTAGDVTLDEDTAVSADTITAGALSATNVEPASLVAGATGNATVTFTTANPVTNSGKIAVIFPAGFDVASASVVSVGNDLDGTTSVGVAGQTVTVTRTGGTTLLATETGSVVLGNITNPPGSGSTGTYTIRTTTAGDVTIDEDGAVTADTITVGALTSTDVEPASLAAAATGNVTVSFTTTNALTNSGKIVVIFPAGFDVSAVTFDSVGDSLDGTATVAVVGQTVTVTRTGGCHLRGGGHRQRGAWHDHESRSGGQYRHVHDPDDDRSGCHSR